MTRKNPRYLTRNNTASNTEFLHYAYSMPMRDLKQLLQRHERTIQRWIGGTAAIPRWAVDVLRLSRLEHQLMMDQMGFTSIRYEKEKARKQPGITPRPAANDASFLTPSTWSQINLDLPQQA
jgi:hypothetical protein